VVWSPSNGGGCRAKSRLRGGLKHSLMFWLITRYFFLTTNLSCNFLRNTFISQPISRLIHSRFVVCRTLSKVVGELRGRVGRSCGCSTCRALTRPYHGGGRGVSGRGRKKAVKKKLSIGRLLCRRFLCEIRLKTMTISKL
jgi:hypothetical protein